MFIFQSTYSYSMKVFSQIRFRNIKKNNKKIYKTSFGCSFKKKNYSLLTS